MNRTIYIRSVSRERAHKITPVSRSQTTMTTMNGKKPSSIPSKHQSEAVTQHCELIKYILDSWNSVSRELDMSHSQSHSNSSNHKNGATVTYYQEHEPNPHLKNFKPFNLEAYWGQRVVQTITRNSKS
ncbi:mapk-regulated corepressor-interacting protein 1-like isoform X1 [Pseudomyrmex gracilis]|uniref:mapk-regulated corepressor-interacting protein 1-like isoform X1 n=1 Tax=Pseudomyrmex gracilis TaxID=219809 RepID=UPI000994EACB|nr:mapk-regulated corepressor-interacting protein 1-like isoform X1 [Pseudomyrmex gracilis]